MNNAMNNQQNKSFITLTPLFKDVDDYLEAGYFPDQAAEFVMSDHQFSTDTISEGVRLLVLTYAREQAQQE